MKLTVGGTDLQLFFEYTNGEITRSGTSTPVRQVCCKIRPYPAKPQDEETPVVFEPVIAEGGASCSPLDNFEKGTGRRLALQRALEAGPWTRAQREEFWNWYRTTTRDFKQTQRAAEPVIVSAE
jgi:hypothetical protein